MEFLLLLAIGFLVRGAMEHSKGDRGRSRDQRTKEVARSFPKGALPKSKQRSAARHAAAGWWAREVRHGFPVHRTGWHAAWLAHQTVADHHKARREEARTTALETRASVLKGMPEHKQRQAEAQAELDKIEEELAAQRAKGSPATGRKAVESAADEVARRREQRVMVTDVCPNCGAPDGYEHLKGCERHAPPLPADGIRPDDRLDGTPPPRNNPLSGEPVGWQPGTDAATWSPGDGETDQAAENEAVQDAIAARDDWREAGEQVRTAEAAGDEQAADAARQRQGAAYDRWFEADHRRAAAVTAQRLQREDDPGAAASGQSPTTQGAPVADTNYDVVMENARKRADEAEQDAVAAKQRHTAAMQHAEDMQAVGVQGTTLSAQMELVEQLDKAEKAAKATGEQAAAVRDALAKEHGGIKSAVDDAPIARPADADFYVGS